MLKDCAQRTQEAFDALRTLAQVYGDASVFNNPDYRKMAEFYMEAVLKEAASDGRSQGVEKGVDSFLTYAAPMIERFLRRS